MPMTALARTDRSDHSMPPPAIIACPLPDISTICHVDEDATARF
jgi:hypothetical protein